MSKAPLLKDIISQNLAETRAYAPLRAMYQAVFNREHVRLRNARREFFRRFVEQGSLVFDVGANVGDYVLTFLELGARVVAVEPNPVCCRRIRALGHKDRLTVRCEAAGQRTGECDLHVGDYSPHSTISERWMTKAAENNSSYRWKETIQTRLNTLDEVRREHGTPDFIKIDVEGHEAAVLRGMSFVPAALGFEFHPFTSDQLEDCLSLPLFGSSCVFNIALGDDFQFVWPDWREKNAVRQYVRALPPDVVGDIYARF
jgi:FkbM family methyltransferase